MRKANFLLKSILLLLVSVCCACSSEEGTILPQDITLKTGDIVFRRGRSWESHLIVSADPNGKFSHVGIVVDAMHGPMIVHAVPDEPDYPGDPDRIKMDKPEDFFSVERAISGEIMRISREDIARKAAEIAKQAYYARIPFDHDFDDTDNDKLYCTELIIYAFRSAGLDLEPHPRMNITFPVKFKGYFPSAIHRSASLTSVNRFGSKF